MFDYTVIHRPGRLHINVDTPSRYTGLRAPSKSEVIAAERQEMATENEYERDILLGALGKVEADTSTIADRIKQGRDGRYYRYRYRLSILWPPIPSIGIGIDGSQASILVSVSVSMALKYRY